MEIADNNDLAQGTQRIEIHNRLRELQFAMSKELG
jgi:hypothetical protein